MAYQENYTKHRMMLQLFDLRPKTYQNWVAPNATLAGEVILQKYATIWYNTVIRGDINAVKIGFFTSIGDNCVIHTAASLPTGLPAEVNIGDNVTIQNRCTLYSCFIDNDAWIGAGSTICEGARVEKAAMIAPGSVVPPGRLIPAKQLWAGNPVEYVKDLDIGEAWANYSYSYVNVSLGDMHLASFAPWGNAYLDMPSAFEDVNVKEEDCKSIYVAKDMLKGSVKYYC